MSDDSNATANALLNVVLNAYEEGWIDRLAHILRKRHRVLVVGATGVGKSQLIASLTKLMPKAISHLNRTEFVERHKITIQGNLFEFIELPGDDKKELMRRKVYHEVLVRPVDLVLNVVSYGYHEYRIDNTKSALTRTGAVKEEYLIEHRNVEIRMFEEWAPFILDPSIAKTVITVVTKADIWWNDAPTVMKHYYEGEPHLVILKSSVPHAISPYSSVNHRMFRIGKLSDKFDDSDKRNLRAELFQKMLSSIGKCSDD